MRMSKFSVLILSAVLFCSGSASSASYEDGKSYCNRIAPMRESELNSSFLEVPIDYKDPSKGKTEIYYSLSRKFDSKLPTMIFFTGGPGGASHFQGWKNWEQLNTLDANIVQFDQRGIACSRPATESLYTDPQFYSSENTARDAEEIRKHLGASQITAYGVSYGTVPATIYSNIFESSTKSLILEGVVFSGFDYEEKNRKTMIRIIQKYFDSLPLEVKSRWIRLVEEKKAPNYWFPSVVESMLMKAGEVGWNSFQPNFVKSMSEPDDETALKSLGLSPQQQPAIRGVPAVLPTDSTVNGILFCKELGASVKGIGKILVLNKGKVEIMKNPDGTPYNDYAEFVCPKHGLANAGPSQFTATQYPVKVPVYYMQGTLDSATPPRGAVHHYKLVPKGPAYLLLFHGAGHTPSAFSVTAGLGEQSPFQPMTTATLKLFSKAFEGQPWLKEDTKGLNLYNFKTSFTSK